MKIVTFSHNGKISSGYLEKDEVVVCGDGVNVVQSLIERGGAGIASWLDYGSNKAPRVNLADVRLLSPIPEPRRDLFCIGKNYYAHAEEFHASGFDSSGAEAIPLAPIIFTKATTSVVGPDAMVLGSLDYTNTVDYEGELGVIIGSKAFQVSKVDAYSKVFGSVVINDVTSRELQRHHNQWVIGKGLDTFCPMGPYIVTADEVDDVTALELETRINGEVRQKSQIANLIFDIPTLIRTITRTMTLLPGDIIATGTPDGVGVGFNPPKYLKKGDKMSVSITGLGELNNVIG
jgi:2-keto-4-pentenoate hydratase/2-oxohepta-3-ene-1,7-dioic acid hydratase in catechol pathway